MINNLILYYHSIGHSPLSLHPKLFENQLLLLIKHGYRSRLISELHSTKAESFEKNIFLTFDDCFLDNCEHALPLLKKYNFCATFYAIPGYDNLTLYGDPNIKKWSQTKHLGYTIPFHFFGSSERIYLKNNGMEIGCHTLTHPNLDTLTIDDQLYEIRSSKDIIESEINSRVESFCYPRGRYNNETIQILNTLNFSNATTTTQRYLTSFDLQNKFEIPRFAAPDNIELLNSLIMGNGKRLNLFQRFKSKMTKLKRTL